MQVPDTLTSADARWHAHAACATADPDSFFAMSRGPAKALCSACPAVEPCLWAALALEAVVGYRHGVWGGTSAGRRARIAVSLPDRFDYTGWYLGVVDDWAARHGPAAGRLAA